MIIFYYNYISPFQEIKAWSFLNNNNNNNNRCQTFNLGCGLEVPPFKFQVSRKYTPFYGAPDQLSMRSSTKSARFN